MTNKLFIIEYIFVDVNIDKNVNKKINKKISIFLRNSNIENNKREDFDDINFETIFAQKIYFFDIAKNVANKINSIKINKINTTKLNKIINVENKVNDKVKNYLENKTILLNTNKTNSLKNEVNICFTSFIANFF